jgi:hypothetical protein
MTTTNLLEDFRKQARAMSKKRLLQEYSGVVNQMAECSFGTYELYWRDVVEAELDRRDITPEMVCLV